MGDGSGERQGQSTRVEGRDQSTTVERQGQSTRVEGRDQSTIVKR